MELVLEHGYGADSASGRLLLLANRQEGNVIRGFRSTAGGTGQFDFIPGTGAPPRLTTELVVGDTPPAMYGTLPLIGAYGQAWVAENSLIPRGHVLAVASAGPNSPYNVLRFREHTTANLRGMKLVKAMTYLAHPEREQPRRTTGVYFLAFSRTLASPEPEWPLTAKLAGV